MAMLFGTVPISAWHAAAETTLVAAPHCVQQQGLLSKTIIGADITTHNQAGLTREEVLAGLTSYS